MSLKGPAADPATPPSIGNCGMNRRGPFATAGAEERSHPAGRVGSVPPFSAVASASTTRPDVVVIISLGPSRTATALVPMTGGAELWPPLPLASLSGRTGAGPYRLSPSSSDEGREDPAVAARDDAVKAPLEWRLLLLLPSLVAALIRRVLLLEAAREAPPRNSSSDAFSPPLSELMMVFRGPPLPHAAPLPPPTHGRRIGPARENAGEEDCTISWAREGRAVAEPRSAACSSSG